MANDTLYKIRTGDTLSGIAKRFGLKSWKNIYDYEKNAKFRKFRRKRYKLISLEFEPLIYPRDRVWIPEVKGSRVGTCSGKPCVVTLKKVVTVPIIFIPGIMGSRLGMAGSSPEQLVWDPDSNWTMLKLIRSTARTNRTFLGKSKLAVAVTCDQPGRDYFGWGGISWSYYGGVLEALERMQFTGADTPVYAFGYDWRKSNEISGKALKAFIDEVCEIEAAKSVILVTHSMGGLVARSCVKLSDGEKKVLAVIHGVQPCTGAPLAYRQLKAGRTKKADGLAMMAVLGGNPKSVAMVASAMPGSIELLPTDYYSGDEESIVQSWLIWEKEAGENNQDTSEVLQRQRGGDSDGRVTPLSLKHKARNDIWYVYGYDDRASVIPKEWLAQADDTVDADEKSFIQSIIKEFRDNIEAAREFHDKLKLQAHPHTHLIACTGSETDYMTVLSGEDDTVDSIRRTTFLGDGTVPVISQTALHRSQVDMYHVNCEFCEQGSGSTLAVAFDKIGHGYLYNKDNIGVTGVTLEHWLKCFLNLKSIRE